jgi:hypothetical protein
LKALFSIQQGRTIHCVMVSHCDEPRQAALDIRAAIDGMASKSSVIDMGDFAASFVATGRTDYGAAFLRLEEGWNPDRNLTPEVGWHFLLSRPQRVLRVEIRRVIVEDKRIVQVPVWSGTFADMERQITAISRNHLGKA